MRGIRGSSAELADLPVKMADVREAEERVRGHVHRTPVLTCSRLDSDSGHTLFFKCELFQKAGSFKVFTHTHTHTHTHTLQFGVFELRRC